MKNVTIPGTDLTVSALCLGVPNLGTQIQGERAEALLGAFLDAGGNFFDTAHCYAFWLPGGDGASEQALGDYLQRHKVRDRVVIGTKGGHPSVANYRLVDRYLSEGRIAADLDDSLARLKCGTIDLYWLHRDDPRVPAGEIVEILAAEARRGRIRYYGGSNWSAARLAEANAYAASRGLHGFVASEPEWSLVYHPQAANTMRVLNEEDYAWHCRSGMPVIPYHSTAGGFFATHGERAKHFRNATNLGRLERAETLARELGATPHQIAIAWLRHQPFPVVPILGTSDPGHLHDALGALDVSLSPQQVAWLRDGT